MTDDSTKVVVVERIGEDVNFMISLEPGRQFDDVPVLSAMAVVVVHHERDFQTRGTISHRGAGR